MSDTRTRFIPLLGLVIAIALAYAINQWLTLQERNFRVTSNYKLYSVWLLVSGLFIIIVWLALGWITLKLGHRSVLVSIIFLVAGLLVFSYPILWQSFRWIPTLVIYWTDTPLAYTGIFIVVIGTLNLLRMINRSEKS